MRVVDIMSRVVVSLPAEAAWQTALSTMREHNIHHMPVVDGSRVVGLIRESDIQRAAMIEGQQQNRLVSLDRVMVRKIHPVAPCALLADALELMLRHHVSILPVVEEGRLVGVVTHADILAWVAAGLGSSQDTLTVRLAPSDKIADVLRHFESRLQNVVAMRDGDMVVIFRLTHGQAESNRLLDKLQVDWRLTVRDAVFRVGSQPVASSAKTAATAG